MKKFLQKINTQSIGNILIIHDSIRKKNAVAVLLSRLPIGHEGILCTRNDLTYTVSEGNKPSSKMTSAELTSGKGDDVHGEVGIYVNVSPYS